MFTKLRHHLTYANVVSTLCLFILLGGSAFAAVRLSKNSVRSKHIKNGQVQRVDLRSNAVNSAKVGDGSLLAQDFAAGQLPKGEKGAPGAPGQDGTDGQDGTEGQDGTDGQDGTNGQNGAPGMARAYGATTGNCSGSPEFCIVVSNRNIAYVVDVGAGIYCVGVNGITPATGAALASTRFTIGVAVQVNPANQSACGPSEFEIRTFDVDRAAEDRAFSIAIL